jgi:ParB family chromosome partitioning protein
LGKGLGALIGDRVLSVETPPAPAASAAMGLVEETLPDGARLLWLDPSDVQPNPKQPRRVFTEDALEELAESIRRDGVQEPVIVRMVDGKYELVSGERRVRASILADVTRIPAVCREVSDRDMLKLGIIENIQREDLNAIELALAYQELLTQFEWTQEQLADEVGKKRVTVTNTLRLLNLPEVVQEQVSDGSLSMGHARALLALETPKAQIAAAKKIIELGLSVRQAEQLATAAKPAAKKADSKKDPNVAAIEDTLRRSLGTKVALKSQSNGHGRIEIEYYSLDELDRLLALLRATR